MVFVVKVNQGNGSQTEPLEAALYPAIIQRVVDLGLQAQEYQGVAKRPARKVLLVFSIPSETLEINGENLPRHVSKSFVVSLHEKARFRTIVKLFSPQALEPGGEFNMLSLLGKQVMVQVDKVEGKDGRHYNQVANIVPLPKGGSVEIPADNHDKLMFLDLDDPNKEVVDALPLWVLKEISNAVNFATMKGGPMVTEALKAKMAPKQGQKQTKMVSEESPI